MPVNPATSPRAIRKGRLLRSWRRSPSPVRRSGRSGAYATGTHRLNMWHAAAGPEWGWHGSTGMLAKLWNRATAVRNFLPAFPAIVPGKHGLATPAGAGAKLISINLNVEPFDYTEGVMHPSGPLLTQHAKVWAMWTDQANYSFIGSRNALQRRQFPRSANRSGLTMVQSWAPRPAQMRRAGQTSNPESEG